MELEEEYHRLAGEVERAADQVSSPDFEGPARSAIIENLNRKAARLEAIALDLDAMDAERREQAKADAQPITQDEWDALTTDKKRKILRFTVARVEVTRSAKGKRSGPVIDFSDGRVSITAVADIVEKGRARET